MTVRECARLQTFPDKTYIAGTREQRQRQIGNAVPCLLAEVIGRAIKAELLGRPPKPTTFKLALPRKKSVPKPERIYSPNRQYHHMIGHHQIDALTAFEDVQRMQAGIDPDHAVAEIFQHFGGRHRNQGIVVDEQDHRGPVDLGT